VPVVPVVVGRGVWLVSRKGCIHTVLVVKELGLDVTLPWYIGF